MLILLYHILELKYIRFFFTIATIGVGIRVVLFIEDETLQSSHVTLIPPYISFAAYTVAFFFPDRRLSLASLRGKI
jgi:hypothetical protein